jgi:hypothetical protein
MLRGDALSDKDRLLSSSERKIITVLPQRRSNTRPSTGLNVEASFLPALETLARRLPPGLQKRLEPVPADLDRRLPRLPDLWERVVLERDVILIDRRTNRILDIIENVIAVATGR